MSELTRTPRSTVRRKRDRGVYDRAVLNAIVDEALVCHVGFCVGGQPYVIPTTHARVEDVLYLHGAQANHMLGSLGRGLEVCVSVTLLDGLVLARSAMHHSVNYRSATIFGVATEVTDPAAKAAALAALVDHVVPGRAGDARPPSPDELRATLVLALPIEEASAKVRTGPPIDDAEDLALAVWAGVIPLRTVAGPALAAPELAPGAATPGYVADYRRPTRAAPEPPG